MAFSWFLPSSPAERNPSTVHQLSTHSERARNFCNNRSQHDFCNLSIAAKAARGCKNATQNFILPNDFSERASERLP